MTPVALIFLFFSIISLVFCAEVHFNNQLEDFDTKSDAEEEIQYILVVDDNGVEDAKFIPPPPNSELMKSRKTIKTRDRSNSFHLSETEIKNLDTKDVYMNLGRYSYDSRSNSGNTFVDNWEGFIMDIDSMYPTRSNSRDLEKREEKITGSSSFDSYNPFSPLKKAFDSHGTLSRRNSSSRTPRLTSFSETEEELEEK